MIVRFVQKNGKVALVQVRMSSNFERDEMSRHDEWTNYKMPRWAKQLFDDPNYLEKFRVQKDKFDIDKPPTDEQWKKKAWWRRLPWTRTYEHFIPEVVDDVTAVDRPTLAMKIMARFKGIPLKGETDAPQSIFRDMGKVKIPGPEIPPFPQDFKEFPERDMVNFPNKGPELFAPKHRLVIIPDSWFQAFYKTTGVSGPYLILGGVFAFLLNKEILALNTVSEDFMKMSGFFFFYLFMQYGYGYKTSEYRYKLLIDTFNKCYDIRDEELKTARDFRLQAAQAIDSNKAVKENFPTILKENLALQLEAAYRNNVNRAYKELKRRLDYLSEVEETKSRFERDMIIKTITEKVRNSIVNNENKIRDRFLDNCILQLKTLQQ